MKIELVRLGMLTAESEVGTERVGTVLLGQYYLHAYTIDY